MKNYRLTELCAGPLDWIKTPIIPKNAVPIGRPTIIKGFTEVAQLSDFDNTYGEIVKNRSPEEANAYIVGRSNKDWAIQFYKISKD